MIEGVKITPLKQIFDERGKIMHMIRADSEVFTQFGEIYFSRVDFKEVKAWKRHRKMTLNLAVPVGEVKFVFSKPAPFLMPKVPIVAHLILFSLRI